MAAIITPTPGSQTSKARLDALQARLEPTRSALAGHGIYAALRTPEQLHTFLEHHVFAVWDFMSLVKALQRALTCTAVPWVPRGDPALRRFISEIVLGEECDVDADGQVLSHFELYLRAMGKCGADTGPIMRFVSAVAEGEAVVTALHIAGAPSAAAAFVRHTFSVLSTGDVVAMAASFTFAREDVIPVMFRHFVDELDARLPGAYDDLAWYLDRHIAIDGESHGPLGRRLMGSICGDDEARWDAAARVALSSLEARHALWDGIMTALQPNVSSIKGQAA